MANLVWDWISHFFQSRTEFIRNLFASRTRITQNVTNQDLKNVAEDATILPKQNLEKAGVHSEIKFKESTEATKVGKEVIGVVATEAKPAADVTTDEIRKKQAEDAVTATSMKAKDAVEVHVSKEKIQDTVKVVGMKLKETETIADQKAEEEKEDSKGWSVLSFISNTSQEGSNLASATKDQLGTGVQSLKTGLSSKRFF